MNADGAAHYVASQMYPLRTLDDFHALQIIKVDDGVKSPGKIDAIDKTRNAGLGAG